MVMNFQIYFYLYQNNVPTFYNNFLFYNNFPHDMGSIIDKSTTYYKLLLKLYELNLFLSDKRVRETCILNIIYFIARDHWLRQV